VANVIGAGKLTQRMRCTCAPMATRKPISHVLCWNRNVATP